jgi:hypothetical protein
MAVAAAHAAGPTTQSVTVHDTTTPHEPQQGRDR